MSWPKDGPHHFTIGAKGDPPMTYCQYMNPIVVKHRVTRKWRKVTCRNCWAKKVRAMSAGEGDWWA